MTVHIFHTKRGVKHWFSIKIQKLRYWTLYENIGCLLSLSYNIQWNSRPGKKWWEIVSVLGGLFNSLVQLQGGSKTIVVAKNGDNNLSRVYPEKCLFLVIQLKNKLKLKEKRVVSKNTFTELKSLLKKNSRFKSY